MSSTALETMVGGNHYHAENENIQPVEFYHANPQLNLSLIHI